MARPPGRAAFAEPWARSAKGSARAASEVLTTLPDRKTLPHPLPGGQKYAVNSRVRRWTGETPLRRSVYGGL